MFLEFFRFELQYWFRGWMVYIFLAVITLLFFGAAYSDNVTVGGALGNTHRNAPYVVQTFYTAAGILSILMTTAFIDSAASRDFTTGSSALIFSKPISKFSYLGGRFLGAVIAAVVPSIGVSLGILIAGAMPNNIPEHWGPENWMAHLQAILIFTIPNTLFFGSLIFILAVTTRSTLMSFLGTLLMLVGFIVSSELLSGLENERLAALLDPVGAGAFSIVTKYWTVEEKNTLTVPLTGLVLTNRIIWLSVAAIAFTIGYRWFTFAERQRRGKTRVDSSAPSKAISIDPVLVEGNHTGLTTQLAQFRSQLASDWRAVIRSTVFVVILFASLLNMIPTVWFNLARGYGLSTFPVTYDQVNNIRGSLYIFLIAIITFFAGVLVWRERDVRAHEIFGALPTRNWTSYLSKLLTLISVVVFVLLLGICLSVLAQLAGGYTRLQLDLYFKEMLILDLLRMTFLIVLALFAHTVAPNKYVGYFVFIVLLVINAFAWNLLSIDTSLFRYGRLPPYVYSDMYGFQPYVAGIVSFAFYWILFCILLGWVTIQLWQRGPMNSLISRMSTIPTRLYANRLFVGTVFLAWIATAGWLFYNTQVLNETLTADQIELRLVEYERKYKDKANLPQPRVTKVHYTIDLYPEKRDVTMVGKQTILNKSSQPIEDVYLSTDNNYDYEISIEGAERTEIDERLSTQVFRFSSPMQPGESRSMEFTVRSHTDGIESSLSNPQIMQNGTFFNNTIAPQIGYQKNVELRDPKKRRKHDLPIVEALPELSRECSTACMEHYVSGDSDWVDVETVISTSSDQIAVAPGSLVERWEKDGRTYFRYRLDHPSLNFYSFVSARYEVERAKSGDVDLEVYYHKDHAWNVPKMVKSMEKSLDYYSQHFGPYKHKQARIIEFPRIATFAQAFPGTMPYSEGIGFIANLENPDDIDMVFYVVAHEMAHQWWAHQVVGARMQGATLLSETLAQYSALMVMEHEYGRDMMRKFLRYEMDSYLRSRGGEIVKERPLLTVNPEQGYVHYRKGSVALYYLKELIGEDRVNAALREVIERFAYKEPPYPNAYHLVDALKKHTPEELQPVIVDLFETITLYSNRVLETTATQLPDGKYEIVLKVECGKLRADEEGKEEPTPIDQFVEIGAFSKPEKGKKYGATLYRERVRVKDGEQEFRFIVDALPATAGIDPFCLLIDRVPDDNVKSVTLKTASTK